jgi:hypothetical protein
MRALLLLCSSRRAGRKVHNKLRQISKDYYCAQRYDRPMNSRTSENAALIKRGLKAKTIWTISIITAVWLLSHHVFKTYAGDKEQKTEAY